MPYGLMYQGQSDEEQDPAVAQVLELLRSLEPSAPPIAPRQPQQPSMGQSVFGGIGDALTSMASVRAGGGPIGTGPFAAQQQARQRSYEEQLLDYNKRMEENAAADRTLRNTVRIGASQESMRAKRELEVAKVRNLAKQRAFQQKTFQGKDESGKPVSLPYNYDPNTGTLAPVLGYEEGFQRYVRPFLATGMNADTGEMEFRLLDPFSGAGVGDGKGELKPPPSEEASQRAANLAGFSQGIARLKELLPPFIKSRGGGSRLGQQVLRQAPMVGPQISERMSKEGEQVAAVLQRVKADFVRIMSGLQASETEQKRLAGTLPDIGTVDAATALSKIEEFEAGIRAYAREKYRQRPSLFSPELIQELGLEGIEVAPRKSASERLDEILAGTP